MASEPGKEVERLGRLPRSAVIIVGALAAVGAVTMLQRVLAIFSWLLTVVMFVVVMVALIFWLAAGRRQR